MSAATHVFDPYHKWLGIPSNCSLRHYYLLLGLELFEADHEAINNAADRRMAQLQCYECSDQGAIAKEIIAELAQASATLVNDDLKQAYDDQLRLQLKSEKYGFYDRLRVRIRRLQQTFNVPPFVFCLLGPVIVFALFAVVGVLCTGSFGLALLAGVAGAAVGNILVADAYLAPNPDAAESSRPANVWKRRLIWATHVAIAAPAFLVLVAMTIDLTDAIIPTIATVAAGVLCLAFLAYRNAQNHARATTRSKRVLPEIAFDEQTIDASSGVPLTPQVAPAAQSALEPSLGDGFDPYHKWLGIPPHAQPADHYQLLGVQTFEDDLDVIQNLSDQRMIQLKAFATGPRSHESQLLLNEVMRATSVLLQPQRKNQYDSALRQALTESGDYDRPLVEAAPEMPPQVESTLDINIRQSPVKSGRHRSRKRLRRRRTSGLGFVVQILLGGVVGIAVGWFILAKWIDPRWDYWGIVSPLVVHAPPESAARAGREWQAELRIDDWHPLWRDFLTYSVRAEDPKSGDAELPKIVRQDESLHAPKIVWTPQEDDAGKTHEFTVSIRVASRPELSRNIPVRVHVQE